MICVVSKCSAIAWSFTVFAPLANQLKNKKTKGTLNMLNPKVQDALNKQINAELHSAYLYASMAAYFEAESYRGMAAWMQAQSKEEIGHAMRIFDFINDRNGRVILTQIDAPKTQWDSPLDVFEGAHRHECAISRLIHELLNLATAENDPATVAFLQWFVNEQVEEEAHAQQIVDKLKLVGNQGPVLYMMDKELGARGGG
jgi:ferritin